VGIFKGETQPLKVLIDTNIIVDVALERQPFYPDSQKILSIAYHQQIEGYISASTVSDLYYIIRKVKGRSLTLEFLQGIVTFCPIAAVDRSVIAMALTVNFKDFEDSIQYGTAITHQMDAIVTRNPKDFTNATNLQILTPHQLIQTLKP
jgi:predicted nucleic acid-binding protein